MKIAVLSSDQDIAVVAADMYCDLLNQRPDAVIGLATGSSPVATYDELVRRYKAGEVSFAQTTAFLLDEYVGLPDDHPESYRNFITRVFTSRVDFAPDAVNCPEGRADDPYLAAEQYESSIRDAGGIELQILGIGTDGHIGFNEPGGSLSSDTHVQSLTEQTRIDNARFFDGDINQVPHLALTQGLGTISRASKIVLVAQGEQKAEAIAQIVEGGVSAMWPGSILQFHEDVTVLIDEGAASRLKLIDHYKVEWAASHS